MAYRDDKMQDTDREEKTNGVDGGMTFVCRDCPRSCGAARNLLSGSGFCGAGTEAAVAKVMTHMWEEPCISGINGAGNIFFAGCSLHCIYCQNEKISSARSPAVYKSYSAGELRRLFIEIAKSDVHNVNLVTGDHYIRVISDALDTETKKKIGKPVIFNCSGYEKDDTIELMRNKIDVFLPDFKYSLSETAAKYSFAPDYPETAKRAILKMFGMTGPCSFDKNGMITKGVIIRHLILPGNLGNTFGVIDWVNENFKPGEVVFSLMSQYTPCRENNISAFPELCRKLTDYEKRKAEKYLLNTDITLAYTQEDGSAEEAYIPVFN